MIIGKTKRITITNSYKIYCGAIMSKKLILLLLLSFPISEVLIAQSSIEIYGYAQSSYLLYNNKYDPYPPQGEQNYTYHNMGINQLNLFFNKDFGDNFSSFINLEFINNYSSDKGFGSFNLQEAYIKWDYRDFLKVKFGMIIPQFNSLFEIYNRTPLLPYIIRPKLYDATTGNLVDIFDILPQKALIQIYGVVPIESANIEYALFAGNPPNKFLSSPDNDILPGYVPYGQSGEKFFCYGGRIGLKYGNLKAGVSGNIDVDNRQNFIKNYSGDVVNLGNMDRYRLGVDIYLSMGKFEFSSEFLIAATDVPTDIQDSLNTWNASEPYFIGKSFDKKFFYATLQYNYDEKLFIYVMYDYLNDKLDPFYFGLDGYYGAHIGGGYYINDSIILKLQYNKNFARYDTGENFIPKRDYSENIYAFGASVTF